MPLRQVAEAVLEFIGVKTLSEKKEITEARIQDLFSDCR